MTDEHKPANEGKETPPDSGAGEKPKGDADEDEKALLARKSELLESIQGLEKTKSGLVEDVTGLRQKRRDLRQEQPPAEEELTTIETTDDLIAKARKTSEDAIAPVKSDVENLRKAQKDKALRRFIGEHKEYSPSEDPDDRKLRSLLDTAGKLGEPTDEYDADLFYERLLDAHVVRNRSSITQELDQARTQNAEREISTAGIAATAGSGAGSLPGKDKGNIQVTDFHREMARRMGKTPEEVAQLEAQYESTLVSPTK